MSDCQVALNNMVDKAKIKDVLLWTVYTNVIDHKNIGYGHVVDLFVNKRCQNITFRDYFFLQRLFGIYGAIFRSVNLNDVLNYANGIEQISKNEKHYFDKIMLAGKIYSYYLRVYSLLKLLDKIIFLIA